MINNHVVVDLNKVQEGWFYYRNQYGQTSCLKPKFSVHGVKHNPEELHVFYKQLTLKQYADQQKLTDVWTPEVKFRLSANHDRVFTGKKAVTMWKEWNRKIFKKKQTNANNTN